MRPPLEIPLEQDLQVEGKTVGFLHPALPHRDNFLFSLVANDDGGLHFGVAHTACAIVAGNAFDGYLSVDDQGTKIEKEWDDILEGNRYYFFVPHLEAASSERAWPYLYPIVPSFYHWSFPHRQLPHHWAKAPVKKESNHISQSAGLLVRDRSCRVTDYAAECDGAHLVPQREEPWFTRERMYQYNSHQNKRSRGPSSLKDEQNMLLLRADIHRLFDKATFVFFPKGGRLGVHVLSPMHEIVNLYHNRELQVCKSGIGFLFARFAWAIFNRLGGFVNAGVTRLLSTVDGIQEKEPDDIDIIGFLDGPPAVSRTPSPKKRKADDLSGFNSYPQGSVWDGDANTEASSPPSNMERDRMPESRGQSNRSSYKRQKYTHEPVDHPPTPPSSASAVSLAPSQEREEDLGNIDTQDWMSEEEKRLLKMKVQGRYAEALRSDPTRSFKKELEWAYSLAGGPIDDVTRWSQAYGYDVPDAEFDFREPIVGSEQEPGDKGAGAGKGDLTEEKVSRLASKVKERVVGSVGVEGYEEDDRVEILSERHSMGWMAEERLACLGALMEDGELGTVDLNASHDDGKAVDETAGVGEAMHEGGNHMAEKGPISYG